MAGIRPDKRSDMIKNKILFPIFFFILLLQGACIPQSTSSGRKTSGQPSTGDDTNQTNNNNEVNTGDIRWYTSGQYYSGPLTVSVSATDNLFLRGTGVDSWLNIQDENGVRHFDKALCLIITFDTQSGQVKRHLRLRATPMNYTDFSTGKTEKLLNVDLYRSDENRAQCQGSLTLNTETVSTNSSAFALNEVCPTCKLTLSAQKLGLIHFTKNSSLATVVLPSEEYKYSKSLTSVGLVINHSNGGSQIVDTCNESTCRALGYDCCIDSQCVRHGYQKPNASSEDDYSQIIKLVTQTPSTFGNYPNVFYICQGIQGGTPQLDPQATPTPTPTDNPDERFQTLLKDYYCLEGQVADPVDESSCDPDYVTVRNKVWKECGCKADPNALPPDDAKNACPDFGLKVTVKDSNNNPLVIECKVPQPNPLPTPFQKLSLPLSGRTTPHRFFRKDTGVAVDDLTTLKGQTVEQEGDTFRYADGSNYSEPEIESYGMNHILGPMRADLSEAFPATVINVEFDVQYVIRTKTGLHTPCPMCSRDSWFNAFSAHPAPQNTGLRYGNGVTAVGHTTRRDIYSTNITQGNYEDTIFGRACFVPPTMLPSSHNAHTNAATQRLNRLKTQAALWANGFQRDWYGFNQGAVIGSFDGVRWFAIGSGRVVNATSDKLFLAINAPYADLSDYSSLTIEVLAQFGPNSDPRYDFDPELEYDSSRQNKAASCQYYHQCEVDSDCITKLGWEYMCASISAHQSLWPLFNMDATEQANQKISSVGYSDIIQGEIPDGPPKRCVYRGAGAPCALNLTSFVHSSTGDQEPELRHLACAPNFYCQNLDGAYFNDKVSRYPELLGSILYGQEANVLGRPLNYLAANASLPTEVKNNIIANMSLYGLASSNVGICRPGKRISSAPYLDHRFRDTQLRTDYISQKGACSLSSTGVNRTLSCPHLVEVLQDEDTAEQDYYGQYKFITPSLGEATNMSTAQAVSVAQQNSCGQESLRASDNKSPFEMIESPKLSLITTQLQTERLPIEACYRRAGSVCHTDLDCSPNRMHESVAFGLDKSYFGNNLGEWEFWQESLVCGQEKEVPSIGSVDFNSFDMTKNRCCRRPGNRFSMYTQSNSVTLTPDVDSSIIRKPASDTGLKADRYPIDNVKASGRYSRYTSSFPVFGTEGGSVSRNTPHRQLPAVFDSLAASDLDTDHLGASKTPHSFQWATLHTTGRRTCCGNTFIRKFADGTHNWRVRDRFKIPIENFQCLNFSNELHLIGSNKGLLNTSHFYYYNQGQFNREKAYLCLSPGDGGCTQYAFEPDDQFQTIPPQDQGSVTGVMTTFLLSQNGGITGQVKTQYAPYQPLAYPFEGADRIDAEVTPVNYFPSTVINTIAFYLPIYMNISGGGVNLVDAYIKYAYPNGTYEESVILDEGQYDFGLAFTGTCDYANLPAAAAMGNNTFCIDPDVNGDGAVVYAKADSAQVNAEGEAWSYAGIMIRFRPVNTQDHVYNNPPTNPQRFSTFTPANPLYYLSKLGRFELSGIPQIYFEPIFCNDNRYKLMPGLFGTSMSQDTLNPPGRLQWVAGAPGHMRYDLASNPSGLFVYGQNGAVVVNSLGKLLTTDIASNDFYHINEDYSNLEQFVAMLNQLDDSHSPIFSSSEFICCAKLGSQVTDPNTCCSGHGVREGGDVSGPYTCLLPVGTDLNVYFNPFVSSEGYKKNLPKALENYGFDEKDFSPETGEPLMTNDVYDKIYYLGLAYCDSGKVRSGALFGKYFAEPYQGFVRENNTNADARYYYSAADSSIDYDSSTESGTSYFNYGFKWNHHYYCNLP